MREGRPLLMVVGGSDTGRTPMVAGLLRAALGEDAIVQTGGVLAHTGESAVTEAQMAVEQLGVSLREHRAQPLTAEHRRDADLLLAVDRGTALVLHSEFPHDERVVSLAALCEQPDVLDPHRMPLGVWVATARQLQGQVTQAVPELRQRLHLATAPTASTADAPTVHASTTNAPTTNDDVEHMTRLLLTAETLPMIVDWTRVQQELVQMSRALAAARTAPDDLLPAAVLMVEGALTHYGTQPSAGVLQRMRQALERFAAPLNSTALAEVGQLLVPEA
jgi:protein-tyrosine-phosphatase